MRPRSLALRVTLLVAFAVLVSSAAGFLFVHAQADRLLRQQLDSSISAQAESLIEEYRALGLDGLHAALRSRVRQGGGESVALRLREPGPKETFIGRPFAAPAMLRGFAELPQPDGTVLRALGRVLPDGAEVVVAADLAPLRRTVDRLATALFGAGALAAILAVLAGLVLAQRLERRLGALADAAGAVMAGDLSRRLPQAGTGDELDRLIATINAMLARIEALMTGMRQVTNDVAHDLRGPLARLRQRLETALAAQSESSAGAVMLHEALGELDQVLATFAAMLRIAEAEAGVRRGFGPVDLSGVVAAVAETYAAAAEEQGALLVAEVAPDQRINGDAALLRQLLANLIENALAHGGAAVRIAVRLRPGPVLEVADDGPGIPPEERAKVVQRFYRLDRSRGIPGTGLGLALVAAVAKLHGAPLTLGDAGPGLRVTLDLSSTVQS
jgi:signal transduction histidine kinase